MKMNLRINGYKKILAGKLISETKCNTFDKVLNSVYVYYVDGKEWYLAGNDLQVIGYTDNALIANRVIEVSPLVSYNTLCAMFGRS